MGSLYDVDNSRRASRHALDRIGDKWTAPIIGLLAERPHRFGELRGRLAGISQKVLAQTLRSLERDGLVERRVLPTAPVTVEYSLTPRGQSLIAPLAAIRDWAVAHVADMLADRSRSEATTSVDPDPSALPLRKERPANWRPS